MIKKNSLFSSKIFNPVKLFLVLSLLLLTPLTLFLMSFAWYDSIEVHITHSFQILNQPGIFQASLVFGAIGLVASLIMLFLYLIIDFYLENMLAFWKKVIFLGSIVFYTLIFINFEIFSAIFINYYFSIELLLAIIFWPLIYGLLISIIFLNRHSSLKNKTDITIKQFLINDQVFEHNDSETTIF